jgi:hypothetical protein
MRLKLKNKNKKKLINEMPFKINFDSSFLSLDPVDFLNIY